MSLYQQASQHSPHPNPSYVDANGNPVYVQSSPVVSFQQPPQQSIQPIQQLHQNQQQQQQQQIHVQQQQQQQQQQPLSPGAAQPQPYPQVYVPAVAVNPHDDILGADQQGLGRFVLRHQATTRKNGAGAPKIHQQKTWMAGYGRVLEYAEAYMFLAIECFKITMACLLAVFVPQKCEVIDKSTNIGEGRIRCNPGDTNCKQDNELRQVLLENPNGDHECSLYENFTDLTNLNIAALVINFVALGFCIFHYWLLLRRERFFIDHFDADQKKNRINLRFQVTSFPRIESRMYFLNLAMFWTSIICIVVLVINVIVSAILVKQYYLNARTATVFITNCLLLGTTMTRTCESAFLGAHNNIALSSIDYEPVSYNIVDEEYVKAKYGDGPNKAAEMQMAPLTSSPV